MHESQIGLRLLFGILFTLSLVGAWSLLRHEPTPPRSPDEAIVAAETTTTSAPEDLPEESTSTTGTVAMHSLGPAETMPGDRPTTTSAEVSSTAAPRSQSPEPSTTIPATVDDWPDVSGPIVVDSERGVTLKGLSISNPDGVCVRIEGSGQVTIENSEIGPCGGKAIEIVNSTSVSLDRLTIHDSASGVYALNSQAVSVTNSRFQDAGRNFVQFDKVTGEGNVIAGNTGTNRLGGSDAEDFVSVYKSSGTSGSPLRIVGNSFRNGGPSNSGSGIMVGDEGGTHILVQGNSLTNPGQAGIGVPGGSNIRVLGNTVFSAAQPWSNVGIYVWNQTGGACGSIEVRDNRVEWYSANGSANPAWDGGNCGPIAGWESNDWDAELG